MTEQYYPTGETSIVIVPPPDVCGYADHYRRLYMADTIHHIEPHVTVTYPFVPYDKLAEAEPRLRQLLAKCPPRRLSFRGFSTFRASGILYLRLADNERVHSLYRAILDDFPDYPAYGGKYAAGFVPHLTVGVFSDPQELAAVYDELSVQRLYIGFDVERVLVKARMSDGVWDTWTEIELGGKVG